MLISEKDFVITKHNSLIEASYKLNLNEQRLLYLCITKLDPRKPFPKDNSFTITAKEFTEIFPVNEKNAYKQIEEASKTLAEQWIKPRNRKDKEQFRWVFGIRYHDSDGKITLGFSPWVMPFLTSLREQFTSLKLSQVSSLKSIYAIRLLEFLMQFKTTGKFSISLDRFKERLDLNEEYTRFYNLKKRVIEPAVKELNEKANLEISWKSIKNKKTISQLEFVFSEKS